MTGIVVSVSVSDTLLLRKGNKACFGECNYNSGFSFAFFHWFFLIILFYCSATYYRFTAVIFNV